MPKLTIDNTNIDVASGTTILDAARQAGIEIPTLCHFPGLPAQTSCFVCVVKVNGAARLRPACATVVEEGMTVESETAEVHLARRTALELLLSDHLGDCLAPCQVACPAGMDIPAVLRLLVDGELQKAWDRVRESIPLPATLGRICAAFCERGCRRGQHDAAISIKAIERYIGDSAGEIPALKPSSGKRVAIIGAGPAGLSAAYYLLTLGHACTLYDEHEEAGGMLRYGVSPDALPLSVLAGEVAVIEKMGAEFLLGTRSKNIAELHKQYDAVLIAAGELDAAAAEALGVGEIERHTLAAGQPGVFAAGSTVHPSRHAARAVGSGHAATQQIHRYLSGQPPQVIHHPFSTHIGKMHEEELALLVAAADSQPHSPRGEGQGTGAEDVAREGARCLHCDCRAVHNCKLRDYSAEYGAAVGKYKGERRTFTWDFSQSGVIYEPGKCIDCGICIQIATQAREELGLAFIGRGFSVRVAVPFGEAIADGLRRVAGECADACPVGALVRNEAKGS
ncbi:MAG: 2Fe-2S iron-sulfur cluster-binding protein [Armatimonadota bacterium]